MMINKIIHSVHKNYWLIGQILLVWHHSIKFLNVPKRFQLTLGTIIIHSPICPPTLLERQSSFFLSTDIHVNYLYVYWNSTKETKNLTKLERKSSKVNVLILEILFSFPVNSNCVQNLNSSIFHLFISVWKKNFPLRC